jgi:hypothetical protein
MYYGGGILGLMLIISVNSLVGPKSLATEKFSA